MINSSSKKKKNKGKQGSCHVTAGHTSQRRPKFIICCETALMSEIFLIANSANIVVTLTSNLLDGLAVEV